MAVDEIEAADGPIPAGTAVLVHTGWDAHRTDPSRYAGDGALSFPGLAPDAARLLVARRIAGLGIDTLGVDPGHVEDFPAHRIMLPAGLWHLEGLVGLERVPARGAWLVAAALPIVAGSGAPARVFAILPAPGDRRAHRRDPRASRPANGDAGATCGCGCCGRSPRNFGTRWEDASLEPDERWQAWADEAARGETRVLFVAERDDRWVGVVGAFLRVDPREAQLISMWVDPAGRGAAARGAA